jgi:hypothetical protein
MFWVRLCDGERNTSRVRRFWEVELEATGRREPHRNRLRMKHWEGKRDNKVA